MKVKPSPKRGRVVVELDRKDAGLMAGFETAANGRSAFRLKKILVPVDFSDCSRKALEYAVSFGKQFGATLLLVHVVEIHYGGALYGPVDFPNLERDFLEDSENRLSALAKEIRGRGVKVETQSVPGRAASRIAEMAGRTDADLILLATHGYTGLKHVFLGSTTEQVVRYAPCPVLVVREKEHDFLETDPA
ncbi:MAG TPA: universal stress protein [Methylomirabilota bacterium]|nr:universal stress protein [Methylomirabilota bacterium]